MRPLQLVNPADLQPGKPYLIESNRPEYKHLNCKGTFVKNKYPEYAYQCTITHFKNVLPAINPIQTCAFKTRIGTTTKPMPFNAHTRTTCCAKSQATRHL